MCDLQGVRCEQVASKHAQLGTTWEDHSCLKHSGFGPYCNDVCSHAFPLALNSLMYAQKVQGVSIINWFEARASALDEYIGMLDAQSPSAGFCVCCSFTSADPVFDAWYQINRADRSSEWVPASMTVEDLFQPRPQIGCWFPRVTFTRHGREWNLFVGESVAVDFMATSSDHPRIVASRFLTICVQSAAHTIWRHGFKIDQFGKKEFSWAYVHGHDIKRGVVIDNAASGARVSPIMSPDLSRPLADDLFILNRSVQAEQICPC